MKKAWSVVLAFLFCVALFAGAPVRAKADAGHFLEINEINFPDPEFRSWILSNLTYEVDAGSVYMTETQVQAVTTIDCSGSSIQSLDGIGYFSSLLELHCFENQLTSLDVSRNTALSVLECDTNQLTALDVSKNTALLYLNCSRNPLGSIDVSANTALEDLRCIDNQLTTLDVSKNTALTYLRCPNNQLTALDVSKNTALQFLSVKDNQLSALDVSKNIALQKLNVGNNHLRTLNLSKNESLTEFNGQGQTVPDQKGLNANGAYTFDMTKIMSKKQTKLVSFPDSTITMSSAGVATLPGGPESFSYRYNASVDPDSGDIELPEIPASKGLVPRDGDDDDDDTFLLDVTVYLTYETLPAFDGTVEWNASDVKYNGKTPYVLYNGSAHTPRFTVKDKNGATVDASHYTYQYRENTNAGTAYAIVTFKDLYSGTAQDSFKIYLPATTKTSVENRDNGIYVEWAKVDGAAGYVVYRRAWSSTTNGWTSFARWDNTTDTHYLDGANEGHRVYAGTRYQYGVKAYFARRVDPLTGQEIGGNVNEPSGNYNLGIVGPLKTTVRITTRVLNSVTGGSKRLTIKWGASKNFTGYEVQIATDQAFTKNVKTVKITDPKTAETTIKSLKSKTTYYARVRSYHEFEGMTYYGGWSNVKSAKTK